MEFIQNNQGEIRLGVFIGVFMLMAILESVLPKKTRAQPRVTRWFTNLALVVIDSVILRIFVPILAVAVAQWAENEGWGVFSQLPLPFWLECVIAVVLLDMLIYWQHVASHHIPVLWRFHQVHHADRDIDVTTGVRFHPVEIVLSMLYKFLCIVMLGAPALAVFLFEVLLNASAMFNHSNIRLTKRLDSVVRTLVVTPDMHRVHHSVMQVETNSNYGFFLSLWDRIFGSYIDQPSKGHQGMVIGLQAHQDNQPSSLFWSLKIPFVKGALQNTQR